MNNSTERGLLAFERFSEQITYRVSDHLSKYTEQLILLKSELMDRQITDLDDMQNILRRYVNDSALEGVGFVLEDGTARSYTGVTEVFDEPIDVLDVHNYPYTVTLSENSINGQGQLLFRILWDGQGDSSAVAIYSYLPLSTISDMLKDTTYGNAGAFVAIVDHEGNHLWNSSDTLENKEGHNVIQDLEIRTRIDQLEEATKDNTGLHFQIALNYGGRDELRRAFGRLAAKAVQGQLDPDSITEDDISNALDTAGIPDPDLLIRTCSEQRLSNFLLWQLAYTEFYISPVPWPDFTKEELVQNFHQGFSSF